MNIEYKEFFQNTLKENNFEKNTRELQNKIKARRNQRIAHMIRNVDEDELNNSRIYLKDLFHLRDQLNLLLSQLSFGTTRLMLPLPYSDLVQHQVGVDSRTDIARILDQIAFESALINLAEVCPIMWETRKKTLEQRDIEEINRYRAKRGLSDV